MSRKKNVLEYMDTGYAWIIVFGSAWMNVFTSGLPKSRGLIFVELMELFGTGASITSMTISVRAVGTAVGGPLAGILADRFGNRPIVIIGGFLMFLGNVLISISPNIGLAIAFYGLDGLGTCCVYGPTMSMLPQYFRKRRSFANGVSVCGASIGFCLLPLLVSFLIEEYAVRGCILITAAMALNCSFAGALLRPTSFYTRNKQANCTEVKSYDTIADQNDTAEIFKALDKRCEGNQMTYEMTSKGEDDPFAPHNSDGSQSFFKPLDENSKGNQMTYKMALKDEGHPLAPSDSNESQPFLCNQHLKDQESSCKSSDVHHSLETASNKENEHWKQKKSYTNRRIAQSADKENALFDNQEPGISRHSSADLVKQRRLALSLQSFGSMSIAKRSMSTPNMFFTEAQTHDDGYPTKRVSPKRRFPNLALFTNPQFVLQVLIWGCGLASYSNTIYILPAFAIETGLSKGQSSMLLSIIGASELCVRAGWGHIGDLGYISREHLVQMFFVMTGILSVGVVHLHTFPALIAFAVLFGVFGGSFICYGAVLCADAVDNRNIASAMGIMLAFGNISWAVCFPILGVLQETTGSYSYGFYFLGGMYLLGAFLPLFGKVRRMLLSKLSVSAS